jgi:hypothetical protein
VAGAQKALVYGLEPVMAALLGMLTGIGGGIARDVLLSNVPAVFRSDIYAVAALAGAAVVVIGDALHLPTTATAVAGAALCFGLRMAAVATTGICRARACPNPAAASAKPTSATTTADQARSSTTGRVRDQRFDDSEKLSERTWWNQPAGTYSMSPGSTTHSTSAAWRASGNRSKSGASGSKGEPNSSAFASRGYRNCVVVRRRQEDPLRSPDLDEEVVVVVGVQRRHRARGAEPEARRAGPLEERGPVAEAVQFAQLQVAEVGRQALAAGCARSRYSSIDMSCIARSGAKAVPT